VKFYLLKLPKPILMHMTQIYCIHVPFFVVVFGGTGVWFEFRACLLDICSTT
jgi:hypothetical protein